MCRIRFFLPDPNPDFISQNPADPDPNPDFISQCSLALLVQITKCLRAVAGLHAAIGISSLHFFREILQYKISMNCL